MNTIIVKVDLFRQAIVIMLLNVKGWLKLRVICFIVSVKCHGLALTHVDVMLLLKRGNL
jgi:hypothetical protein